MTYRLKLEQHAPSLAATVTAIFWWYSNCTIPGNYSKELLAALLSVAAISAGFLTTALSILLPLGSTKTGERLHAGGYMPGVNRYLRSAIFASLTLSAICILLFFSLNETDSSISNNFSTILVAGTVYAAFSLARIAEVLLNIFERMSVPEDKNG